MAIPPEKLYSCSDGKFTCKVPSLRRCLWDGLSIPSYLFWTLEIELFENQAFFDRVILYFGNMIGYKLGIVIHDYLRAISTRYLLPDLHLHLNWGDMSPERETNKKLSSKRLW